MKTIGVGELRRYASKYLKEVAAGESIEITDRGRPVARLVPISSDPWHDLMTAGEVVKAPRPPNVDNLKPGAYEHSVSEALERLRNDERY